MIDGSRYTCEGEEETCMYVNAIPSWMVGIEKNGGYTIVW